jgi:WD40 repeat protein
VQKNAGNYCIVGLASFPRGALRPGRTEGQVLLLDAASGRQVYSRKVGGGVYGVAVSPDGGWFVTMEFVRSWQERPIQPPPFRPVLDYFDWPSPLRIWELETGKQLAVLEGHEKGVTDVAVSPDGRWIASCGWDGTIRVWEVPPSLGKRK